MNNPIPFRSNSLLTAVLLLIAAPSIFCQVKVTDTLAKSGKPLPDEVITKVLDKEFTKITTNQSTNFGNFASLDTKDGSATFAGNLDIGQKSNLGIRVKGGINEGVLPIIKGNQVSSNFSLGLQYNIKIYEGKSFRADATKLLNYMAGVDSIWQETDQKIHELSKIPINLKSEKQKIFEEILAINEQEETISISLGNETKVKKSNKIPLSNAQIDALYGERDKLEKSVTRSLPPEQQKFIQVQIDSINKILLNKFYQVATSEPLSKSDIERLEFQLDSLDVRLTLLKYRNNDIDHQINTLNSKDNASRLRTNIYDQSVARKNKLDDNLAFTGFNIGWFAIIANLNNRSFTTFNALLPYKDQLKDKVFNGFDLGISYSRYRLKYDTRGSYYVSAGLLYVLEDNFQDLDSKTLTEETSYGTPPDTRVTTNTFTVYEGEYTPNLHGIKTYLDSYYFLTANQSIAFHINPAMLLRRREKTIADLTLGALFVFKNSTDEKSKMNTELFYTFNDLFNHKDLSDTSLFKRATLGLRFTFPILFKSNF